MLKYKFNIAIVASDKPDLGLEELHQLQLNVRSRFQVFENVEQKKLEEEELRRQQRPVIKRSTSILTKYRINSCDNENDIEFYESPDDDDEEKNEDADLVRSKDAHKRSDPLDWAMP